MSDTRFDGPACGSEVDCCKVCAREVGHIGDHRADPSAPPAPEPQDDRGNGESDGGQVDAPEPPAAADEAWEALLRDLRMRNHHESLTVILARHRHRIEAALATPPPLDVEVLRQAGRNVQRRNDRVLNIDRDATELAREYAAILAGDHKTGEPQP